MAQEENETGRRYASDPMVEAGLAAVKLWPRARMGHFLTGEIAGFFKSGEFPFLSGMFPDFDRGIYAPMIDRPSDEVSRFIRLGGKGTEEEFRTHSRAVIAGFFQTPEFGQGVLTAQDLVENVSRGEKRRTGEPEVFHSYRSILNFLALCHAAASFDRQTNSILTSGNGRIDSVSDHLNPFSKENQGYVYATAVAIGMHDLREDYKEKGLLVFPVLDRIVVLDHVKHIEAMRLKLPTQDAAQFCEIIIDALTRPKFRPQVEADWESSLRQVEHQLMTITQRIGFEGPAARVKRLLSGTAKYSDRKDNAQTRFDMPQNRASQLDMRAKRIEKMVDTLYNFYIFDQVAWEWQNRGLTLYEPSVPSITSGCLLRLLGFTLDELFEAPRTACQGIMGELDSQGKKSIAVPDIFAPMVLVEDGTAVLPVDLAQKASV